MNNKLKCILILSVFIVLTVTACGQKPVTKVVTREDVIVVDQEPKTVTPEATTASVPSIKDAQVDDKKETVTPSKSTEVEKDTMMKQLISSYFTDPQAEKLVKVELAITFSNDVEKYIAAFRTLQFSGNSELIPLWGGVEMKTITFKDGQITVDIHLPDAARLGAGGEDFALTALRNTWFQFSEVKSIDLLVDGQSVESLMGHVELEHPMVR
ncbi:GerMN domain-containing protein [Paenibacillus sp. CMAA1364]